MWFQFAKNKVTTMFDKFNEYIDGHEVNKHAAIACAIIAALSVVTAEWYDALLFAIIGGLEYQVYKLKSEIDSNKKGDK